MHFRFLETLDHLRDHPASIEETEMTTLRTPNSQDHLKRNSSQVWLDSNVFFGGRSLGRYRRATRLKKIASLAPKPKFTKSTILGQVCTH